jgi:hypothetical protein
MTWDVYLMRFPREWRTVTDIPEDYRPEPIAGRSVVHALLRATVPAIDLTNAAWGALDGDGWSMDVDIGDEDPVVSVMLHIRGGRADLLPVINAIAKALDCRPLDCSTGRFFTELATGAAS